ncbi:MAG: carbohydrate ABC transporter permease [Puniceicoccales bacterium]
MSHISTVGQKHWETRSYIGLIYFLLIFMGATMVIPFLITISGSMTNDYDYHRFRPVPRFLYSQNDRYVKGLTGYFNYYRNWDQQLRAYYPDAPQSWTTWMKIGDDIERSDEFANKYLSRVLEAPVKAERIAADYSEFTDHYPMMDTQVAIDDVQAAEFLRQYYEELAIKEGLASRGDSELRAVSLRLLSEAWETPYNSYYAIKFTEENRYPMGFQGWYPPAMDPKYVDFLRVKNAYRNQMFLPGVKEKWIKFAEESGINAAFPVLEDASEVVRTTWEQFKARIAPASMAVPFALRAEWINFLEYSERARELAGITIGNNFTIDTYNSLAGTSYHDLKQTPFPVPSEFDSGVQELWTYFVEEKFPLRLMSLEVTPELQDAYSDFIKGEIKVLSVANELLGTEHSKWSQFKLSSGAPVGFSEYEQNARSLWMNFVRTLPRQQRIITSSEIAYQRFLLEKYGNVSAVNQVYGWSLGCIEEAFPPLATAYTITFLNNEGAMSRQPIFANYRLIYDFLILNGKALGVTFILVALTILATLTINPLCAYSLSRFKLPGASKVMLFLLATMAFPAMVSAIPAYLLMRDLGMLNTFFALVLPGAANGMAIFILKGFFDSLPQELYEAATIDGAREMQIFRLVAMPMVKPILAINCVSAFITAYNGWEWALIICQDKDMWTLAVWMYQASQWWKAQPWIVSAGFVVISIPTLIVFLSCQKIILKGIVIPSMK